MFDLTYVLATEIGTSTKHSYANTYLSDRIRISNVRFIPSDGRIDMSSLRSKTDIEGVLKEIFDTEEDFMNFLFLREYDGEIIF